MIASKSGLEKHLIPSGWHPAYCFGLVGIGDISTKYGPLTCVRIQRELQANNASPLPPEPEPAPQTHHQPTKSAPVADYSDDDIPF